MTVTWQPTGKIEEYLPSYGLYLVNVDILDYEFSDIFSSISIGQSRFSIFTAIQLPGEVISS